MGGTDLMRGFLREVQTLATVAKAEAGLAERHEPRDPDRAMRHIQAAVAAEAELVELITSPRGQMCLRQLDVTLRSEVVA